MGRHNGKKINRKQRAIDYFEEQKGRCAYCFGEMTLQLNQPNTCEVEHIIPKAHRHIAGPFNEVAACAECNRRKADRPLREFLAELIAER